MQLNKRTLILGRGRVPIRKRVPDLETTDGIIMYKVAKSVYQDDDEIKILYNLTYIDRCDIYVARMDPNVQLSVTFPTKGSTISSRIDGSQYQVLEVVGDTFLETRFLSLTI